MYSLILCSFLSNLLRCFSNVLLDRQIGKCPGRKQQAVISAFFFQIRQHYKRINQIDYITIAKKAIVWVTIWQHELLPCHAGLCHYSTHDSRVQSKNIFTTIPLFIPKLMYSSVTCLLADNVVFLLFLTENNFHHCCHRKVATRHTLPNIQTSLFLRKFSMMKSALFLFPMTTCSGCVSYSSLSAACGKAVSDGGQQAVVMGWDSGHWRWKISSLASVDVQ